MTNLELILNMLAEATTTEISKEEKPEGFLANKEVARQGGESAGKAREDIEGKIGKSVLSPKNFKNLKNDILEN